MAPIALGPKHQDLLKAYIEVSKTSGVDWTTIATKADYPTSKYARDQWALVKSKLLATDNGTPINLADRQIALLKATIEVMKTETDWEKVASVANVKTSKYARDQFAIIRNKLCGGSNKGDTASPSNTRTEPKAVKANQPRKRKKRDDDEDDEDDDGASKPSASTDEASVPKAKKSKKSRKVKVEETEVEEREAELATRIAEEEQEYENGKLEQESDEPESFFETEMYHMK